MFHSAFWKITKNVCQSWDQYNTVKPCRGHGLMQTHASVDKNPETCIHRGHLVSGHFLVVSWASIWHFYCTYSPVSTGTKGTTVFLSRFFMYHHRIIQLVILSNLPSGEVHEDRFRETGQSISASSQQLFCKFSVYILQSLSGYFCMMYYCRNLRDNFVRWCTAIINWMVHQ